MLLQVMLGVVIMLKKPQPNKKTPTHSARAKTGNKLYETESVDGDQLQQGYRSWVSGKDWVFVAQDMA